MRMVTVPPVGDGMVKARLFAMALIVGGAGIASAQDAPAADPTIWSGESAVSGVARSGNTDSRELGVEFNIKREIRQTRHLGEFLFDYGESEVAADAADPDAGTVTEETTNRLFVSYQQDRLLNDRLFIFGDIDYEVDQFSGYDYRGLVSAGFGYDVLKRDNVTWSVSGGPGYRFEQIETTGESIESIAAKLGSHYSLRLNENVSFANDTDITWTEENTTANNKAAVTADLMAGLAARFSFEVTHNTEPPAGTEETDTVTRAALVYAFGE